MIKRFAVGGIVDAFAGASDLANTSTTAGMTVIQDTSVPENAVEVSIEAKVQVIVSHVWVEWVYAQQPYLK